MFRSLAVLLSTTFLLACGVEASIQSADSGTADSQDEVLSDAIPATVLPEPDAAPSEPDVGEADTPASDAGEADTSASDADEADTPEPDVDEADTSDPDVDEADTSDPDVDEADTSDPDVGEVDTLESDTSDDRMCVSDDSGFPDFRSGCRVAADCAQAFHQVDCCGTIAAIGVLESTVDEFLDAEGVCRGEYEACRCAARPSETDDGVVVSELSDFDVECVGGRCVSVGRGDPAGVVCSDRVPTTFPDFDRSCVVYDDCIAVAHQYDCCGNAHMVGVNRAYVETFDANERNCREEFPACGCPVGPLSTDSGRSSDREDVVEAMCREGVCYTFVPL